MPNYWNEEHKKLQSKAIHNWQPWKKSTGPITNKGKSQSSKNSYKHGFCKIEKEIRIMKRIRINIQSKLT